MASFSRYPSLVQKKNADLISAYENISRCVCEGRFNDVDEIAAEVLHRQPPSFLKSITLIDAALHQNRYAHSRTLADDALREISNLSNDQKLLLRLIDGYCAIFTHGALRYGLAQARRVRSYWLQSPLDIKQEENAHMAEIYFRAVKFTWFHSTFAQEDDLSIAFKTSDLPEGASEAGEWATFGRLFKQLHSAGLFAEALTILRLLSPLVAESTNITYYTDLLSAIPDERQPYFEFSRYRAKCNLSRYFATVRHEEAAAAVHEARIMLGNYTTSTGTSAPMLEAELILAEMESKGNGIEYAAKVEYLDRAEQILSSNANWGLADYCLDTALQILTAADKLTEVTRRREHLEQIQKEHEGDMHSLLSTRLGGWRAADRAASAGLLQWLEGFDAKHPLSSFFQNGDATAPQADAWDLVADRYREETLKYHIFLATNAIEPAADALKLANRLIVHVPTKRVQSLITAPDQEWYLEWTSPFRTKILDTFEVLANRMHLSFMKVDLSHEQAEVAALVRNEPVEGENEQPGLGNVTAETLQAVLLPLPVNPEEFDRRLAIFQRWLLSDEIFNRDATQLLIAQLLLKRASCQTDLPDFDAQLAAHFSAAARFVDYVDSIDNPHVRKHLLRNKLQAKTAAYDVSLRFAANPDFATLRSGYDAILTEYTQDLLAGEFDKIGSIYAKLAEIALRTDSTRNGFNTFSMLVLKAGSFFDDLRSEYVGLAGSMSQQIKGRMKEGLNGYGLAIARWIELLLTQYFAHEPRQAEGQKSDYPWPEFHHDIASMIWNLVQRSKNRALNDLLSAENQVPRHLAEEASSHPEYKKWVEMLRKLHDARYAVQSGAMEPKEVMDLRSRLKELESQMAKNRVLADVLAFTKGATVTESELVSSLLNKRDSDIVCVDWFTAQKGHISDKLYMITLILSVGESPDIKICELELGIGPRARAWTQKYLRVPEPERALSQPDAYKDLQSLRGLVAPLAQIVRAGRRMVFCPTSKWDLHRIPLHALEILESDVSELDARFSIISKHNLVTYTFSHSLLRLGAASRNGRARVGRTQCSVISPLCPPMEAQAGHGNMLRAKYEDVEMVAEQTSTAESVIEDVGRAISDLCRLTDAQPVTYTRVTRENSLESSKNVDIVYFLGHTKSLSDKPMDASLLLAPNLTTAEPAAHLTAEAIITETRFNEGAHIFVIACKGGVTQAHAKDEMLGLSTSLAISGARSTLAPLWDIGKDVGADWTSNVCKLWKEAQEPSDQTWTNPSPIDLSRCCNAASMELYDRHGHEAISRWAAFAWYGYWNVPIVGRDSERPETNAEPTVYFQTDETLDFGDIELEIPHDTTLGSVPESIAQPGSSAGSLDLRAASVAVMIQNIVYPPVQQSQPQLCTISFQVSFTSARSCKIEENEMRLVLGANTVSAQMPKFQSCSPDSLSEKEPIVTQVTRGHVLNPQLNVNAAGVGIGGSVRERNDTRTYTIKSGWYINGLILDRHHENDMAKFVANANHYQEEGLRQKWEGSVTVEHTGEAFHIDFEVRARLAYGNALRRLMGWKRKARKRLLFIPVEG